MVVKVKVSQFHSGNYLKLCVQKQGSNLLKILGPWLST